MKDDDLILELVKRSIEKHRIDPQTIIDGLVLQIKTFMKFPGIDLEKLVADLSRICRDAAGLRRTLNHEEWYEPGDSK